jgi:hypothetical protein
MDASEQEQLVAYEPSVKEGSYTREEVIDLAKISLDFLAGLCMPLVYQYAYPPVFLAVWDWLIEYAHKQRDFSRLALGLPRGFGKTTLIKLYIVYCILFTKKKFILVLAANDNKAEAIIADVIDMLDEPNIKRTFGDWRVGMTKDSAQIKKFAFRGRTIILAALGSKGSVRGLNLKNERPDIIVFDDIQTREQADSQAESDALFRWLLGSAMKSKSPHGCLYIFLGNMYPTPHSILRKLKESSTWIKFITGAITEDGESIWEELQPIVQLLMEYKADEEAGHPEIFFSEVLNDEHASSLNTIDITKIKAMEIDLSFPPEGKYIIIDPATNKPGANDTAIGLVYVYSGKPLLVKLEAGVYSPLEAIKKAIIMATPEGCKAIFVESAAYQYTFLFWFNFILEQLGIIGIDLLELHNRGIPKNTRIKEGYKKLVAKDIGVTSDIRPRVVSQFSDWNPLKTNNKDDILDIIGYMEKPLEEFPDVIAFDILDQTAYNMQHSEETDVLPSYMNCLI